MKLSNILIILSIILVVVYSKRIEQENFIESIQKVKNLGSIYDDPLFSDVVTYENDEGGPTGVLKLGIEKCIERCDGKCVEYGITGIAHCYPAHNPIDDAQALYYKEIAQQRFMENNADEVGNTGFQTSVNNQGTSDFPNLR
jgi:hypothetical protein